MNSQRYILAVQNNSIFKEVDVSAETPVIKIGTLQECDVRLKYELFDLPVCVTLRLQGDDWRLSCSDNLYISSRTVNNCFETAIDHGDILDIHSGSDGAAILTLSMSYDFTAGAVNFDTIVDIRGTNTIVIGNCGNANIKLESEFVGDEYIVLSHTPNGKLLINADNAPSSATLNGIRVLSEQYAEEFDFIGLADYSFYYKNQVLYTASREDMSILGLSSQPLREETPAFNYPLLNRNPRMIYKFNTDPIEILNPPRKPEKPKENLVMQLAPALAMMAVTVITRSGIIAGLNTGSPAFLIFSLSTMSVGIMTTVMSFVYHRKSYKKDLAVWKNDYENYIIENYNKAIENGYDDAQLYYSLGLLHEENGDVDMAIRNYSKAITRDPLRPDIRIRKAQLLLQGGHYPEALQALDETILSNPDVFEGYHLKFRILLQLKQYDKAKEVLDSALELFPKDPGFALDKAMISIDQGKYDEAFSMLDEIEKSEEADEAVLRRINMERAQIFATQDKVDKAIEALDKAKALADESGRFDSEVVFLLSNCYVGVKNFEKVLEYSRLLLENADDGYEKSTAIYYEAMALKNLNKNDEAAKAYKEAIEEFRRRSLANPGDLDAYLLRAMCLKDTEQYNKALELADYVIGLQPERAEPKILRISILEAMGRTDEAASEAKAVNSLLPEEMRKK